MLEPTNIKNSNYVMSAIEPKEMSIRFDAIF